MNNAELTEMHFIYGLRNDNAAVHRIYKEQYPNRQIPSVRTFIRLHETARAVRSGSSRRIVIPQLEEAVIYQVENDLSTSTRKLSLLFNVYQSICIHNYFIHNTYHGSMHCYQAMVLSDWIIVCASFAVLQTIPTLCLTFFSHMRQVFHE